MLTGEDGRLGWNIVMSTHHCHHQKNTDGLQSRTENGMSSKIATDVTILLD